VWAVNFEKKSTFTENNLIISGMVKVLQDFVILPPNTINSWK
jgi:hypothetical protein